MSDNPWEASQGFEVAHMGPEDSAGPTNEPIDVASDTLAALQLTGDEGDQRGIRVNSAVEHPALLSWTPDDTRLSPGLNPAAATRLRRGTRASGPSGAGSIVGSRPHSPAPSHARSSNASVPSSGSRHGVDRKGHRRNKGTRLTGAAEKSIFAPHQVKPETIVGTPDLGGAASSSREPAAQCQAPAPVSNLNVFMGAHWASSRFSGSEAVIASGQDQQQSALPPEAHSTPPATILSASSPSQYSQTVGGNEPSWPTDTSLSQPYPNFDLHAGPASVAYTANDIVQEDPSIPQNAHFDPTYSSTNDSAIVDTNIQCYGHYGHDYNQYGPAQPVADSYELVWDPYTRAYVYPDEARPAPGS